MLLRCLLFLLLNAGVAVQLLAAEGSPQLLNPDFEEDADNVGFPDGWKVSSDAEAALTEEGPSSGKHALKVKEGYAIVSQDLEISELAGRRVALRLDARSPDGGNLGVRIGYYVQDDSKGKIWKDVPMIWDKAVPAEYQNLTASRVIPENALDGRFWIGLYRSKKEGTIVVDNFSLEFLDDSSSLDARGATVLQRERDHLLGKLALATSREPNNGEWMALHADLKILVDKTTKSETPESAVHNALGAFQVLNARLLAALYPRRSFTAEWADPFERLNPETLPAETETIWQVSALADEVVSLGVEIANTTKEAQTLIIILDGVSSAASQVQVRRQVLMETWYTKGATLMADPLTLLRKVGDAWELPLEPGEKARLYVAMKVNQISDNAPIQGILKVVSSEEAKALPFEMKIFGTKLPVAPALAHYQFFYTSLNVANNLPAETNDDLEAHGVTDIEWPFMPPAEFSSEGGLLEVDWSTHDRWLAGFKDSRIRLNIFWQSSYKSMKTVDGTSLVPYSMEWKRALKELITAYLDHAAAKGIPRDRFTILPMDEIHSAHLDKAPDEKIAEYVDLAKTIAEAEPKLPQYLTIGNYAFPPDIEQVIPFLNVALPHWPRPERLSRNAPPEYRPREEYFEKTLPLLKEARDSSGLQIWGYHVMSGKSDNLLTYSRAYPLLAVAADLTGFGYWAYNVSSGSTWNDMDGKILDYCLIYDGRENQPLNKKYNITGENIVPSIQWEAIRAGQQDGKILLNLIALAKSERCPDGLRPEIESLVQSIRRIGGKDGYGGPELTFSSLRHCARQLRETYAKAYATSNL